MIPYLPLQLRIRDDFEVRRQTLMLIKALTEMKLTALLMVEAAEERADVQRFGTTEFLAQGVMILHI